MHFLFFYLFRSSGCLTPCIFYDYFAVDSEAAPPKNEIEGTAFIGFYTLSYKIPVHTQVFDYTGSDFVADAGGYLGLLLGTSALSLYRLACTVFDGLTCPTLGRKPRSKLLQ